MSFPQAISDAEAGLKDKTAAASIQLSCGACAVCLSESPDPADQCLVTFLVDDEKSTSVVAEPARAAGAEGFEERLVAVLGLLQEYGLLTRPTKPRRFQSITGGQGSVQNKDLASARMRYSHSA